MPRLARLRFVSVGHRQARMDDLVLDLRNRDSVAMDSTLWLRNGGGKSSILNLFFALLRPDRREFLGGKAEAKKRRLEDYVLPEDRAVVVCEWEIDTVPGQIPIAGLAGHLIIGAFYEWRTGASSEHMPLRRLFFAGRSEPTEGRLTLEGLPLFITQHDRITRRTLTGFRQEWIALRERYPHLQLVQTENLREWGDYLDAAGIDPELFAYQIRMNQREGGVDEIFRFEEDEQFIDFLLELVLDVTLGDKVMRNIGTYRRELKERKDRLIPERDLLAGLSIRLAPMIDFADRRALIAQRAASCAHTLSELTGHVQSRITTLDTAASTFEHTRTAETQRSEEARQSVEAGKRLAAALRLFAATRRRIEAGERLERLRRDMERAAEQYQIWDAAVPLHNALRFERQAEGHRKELERKRSEHAPLLADLQAAARALAETLGYRIARLRSDVSQNDAAARAARSEASEAREFAATCRSHAAQARSEREKFEGFISTSASERKRLEVLKAIREQESGAAAAVRLREEIETSQQQIDQLDRLIGQHRHRRHEQQTHKERCIRDVTQAQSRADELGKRLDEATALRRGLEDSSVLRQCLELEAINLERLPDESVQQLRGIAREALAEIVRIAMDRADDDRATTSLAESGLLPPARDVERVLIHLKSHLPVAWSGWSYLEANVSATLGARRAAVECLPELATGIIVRDPDFEKAHEILSTIDIAPSTPVVVAPQSAFATRDETAVEKNPPAPPKADISAGASTGQATHPRTPPGALASPLNTSALRGYPRFVIGPSTDAYFDRAAAQTELLRRRARLEEYGARERQQQDLRAEVEDMLHRLREFRRMYPRGWFAMQEQAIQHELNRAGSHTARAEAIAAELTRLDEELLGAEASKLAVTDVLTQKRAHQVHVETYVRQHELPLQGWHNALTNAQREQSQQTHEAGRWNAEASTLEESATKLDGVARGFGEDARAKEEEFRSIKYLEGQVTPASGNLDELRDQYRQLQSTYEMNVGAEGLLLLQNAAKANAQEERGKLAAKLNLLTTEARVLAALNELEDSSQVDSRRDEANSANQSAQGMVGQQTLTLKDAAEKLEVAKNTCDTLGNIPELKPSELPVGPIQAESDAEAVDSTVEEDEASASSHAAQASAAQRNHDQAKQAAALLRKDIDQIRTVRETYLELLEAASPLVTSATFVAPTDDDLVAPAIRDSEDQLKTVRHDTQVLNNERDHTSKALRTWLTDARFESLKSPIARQFTDVDNVDLETHSIDWRQQLDLRVNTIDAQLSEMNRHRDILITEVLSAAEEGLSLIKSAANQSRLPQHVPGLGGQQFLRITTHEPADHGERRGRIGALIDELLDEDDVPSGLALVQRSVSKLAKPIRVKVLNPDPDLAGVPVDISDMARFSGGEQLTGAILLYCTLAQLRSRTHGQQRKSSSVLILDNPIGRASRVRFLELQREVARAMGVQLFYTTAVNDHEALRTLPNVIRLRNLRFDRNKGHRVLEHDALDRGATIQSVRVAREDQPDQPDASQR